MQATSRLAAALLGTALVTTAACSEPAEVTPDDDVVVDEPTAAGCFVDGDAAGEQVALPATATVGAFRVAVAPDGRLDVSHPHTAARSLFASPKSGSWLSAARARLHVEEHQGSFTTSEEVDATCSSAVARSGRIVDRTLVVDGTFTDAGCGDVTWQLQLCETREKQLAFRVTTNDRELARLSVRAHSEPAEAIFGAGEQFPHDRLNLKGRRIPILSQEGGVGRGHTPITPAVNAASPGSGGSEDSTYYAVPHYITSELRSVFLENTEYAELDFRDADAIELRAWSPTLVGRVLAGNSPLELVEQFTAYTGRMPEPPSWLDNGAIVALARDLATSEQLVDKLRGHGAALAAIWNQTWSGKATTFIGEQVLWNWTQSSVYHPGWNAFVDKLAGAGIRTLCYVNPMFVDPPAEANATRNLYAEAATNGYFVRRDDGSPYLLRVTAFDAGLLDLSNPQARTWMKDVIVDEMLGKAGCSGWMADFAEALPFDARLHSNEPAATYHNRYPVEWARLNREAIEEAGKLGEVLTFHRSGSARSPGYALLFWEGDQLTTWDKYDGLVSALHGLLSGGFSGIALNHSDTGGYTSLSLQGLVGYEREAEQLARWTELNAFTAVLRTHEGNQPGVNAQVYQDDTAMKHFARFTKVYRALAPYRRSLFVEAAQRGWPVVRHLWMHYPDDPVALTIDDQFLLGSEILVAPIKNKCWTRPFCPYDKELYLPRGEWVHLWSGKVYGSASAGKTVKVAAPIGEPAVFYRRGSPIARELLDRLKASGIDVVDPS